VALVEQDGAAQDLRHLYARHGREAFGQLEAGFRALGSQLYLDELVIEKRPGNLLEDTVGCAQLANLNHGIEGVTGGTQAAAQLARWHEGLLARAGRGRHAQENATGSLGILRKNLGRVPSISRDASRRAKPVGTYALMA
jgi:hypothetical protein